MFVEGHLEVCRAGSVYEFKNLSANWEWHDEIDAKSMKELYQDGENWPTIIVEGAWNLIMDGVLGVNFEIVVNFSDNVSAGQFPPGPTR